MEAGRGGEGEEGGGGDGAGRNRSGGEEGEGNGEAKNMDGESEPSSSFSSSRSSLTRPGASIPYFAAILPNCMRHKHTSRGCLRRTRSSDSKR